MYLCFGTGTFLTSVGRDFLADDGPPEDVSSTSIMEALSLSCSRKEGRIREGLDKAPLSCPEPLDLFKFMCGSSSCVF